MTAAAYVFAAHHPQIIKSVTSLPPPPPVPPPTPQPGDDVTFFSVIALPSLRVTVGVNIGTVTLATVTCNDTAMTIRASYTPPGLTYHYAGLVLTITGTPTGPSRMDRVTISYISSDLPTRVVGTSSHVITVVDPTEVLTIGPMAGFAGRVGKLMSAALANPSANYACPLIAIAETAVPGLEIGFTWTVGASSAAGTLTIEGIPTVAGNFTLIVGYWSNGVQLGESSHLGVIVESYAAIPPAPAPVAGPPGVVPPAPPAPAPAPQPGTEPDPYFDTVKLLIPGDLPPDVEENDTDVVAGKTHIKCNTVNSNIRVVVDGLDASDGEFTVECYVKIDEDAFDALVATRHIGGGGFCPVISCVSGDGSVVWSLGFYAEPLSTDDFAYRGIMAGMFAPNWVSIGETSTGGATLRQWSDAFMHLASCRHDVTQLVWLEGRAGNLISPFTIDGSGFIEAGGLELVSHQIGGYIQLGGMISAVPNIGLGEIQIVGFCGIVDMVRAGNFARYAAYMDPAGDNTAHYIPVILRTVPWPTS